MTNYEIIKVDKPNWNYKTFKRNYPGSYFRTKIFNDHIIPLCKKHNIDYLLHFDSDEFLYLNKFKNIQEMLNYYQPFDELNINWLIFYDNCLKENKTNSLIKSSNQSANNLCGLVKCINKVDSIITGKDSHNVEFKKNSIMKNIFNKILPDIRKTSRQTVRLNNMGFILNETPIFIAHYVYKDINYYVEKKLITYDGNFNIIFSKKKFRKTNNLEGRREKIILLDYHKNHKNDLIDYIYFLRKKDEINIAKLENKHKLFKMYKKFYLNYYKIYGIDFTNNLNIKKFVKNNLLINFLYN